MIRWLGLFSQGTKQIIRAQVPKDLYRQQLESSGLVKYFSPEVLAKSQASVRVYADDRYLGERSHSPSLARVLSNTAAISVAGDRDGYFQDGRPFPKEKTFFSQLADGDPRGLSPLERLAAAKKIISSTSWAFAKGGYPAHSQRELYHSIFPVGIFSQAGAQFEMPYLHYRLFFLDACQTQINIPLFSHLYQNVPTDYNQALIEFNRQYFNPNMCHIRDGLSFLSRRADGAFFSSRSQRQALLFLDDAYRRHLDEDITLLLKGVDHAAAIAGKPAFLKATAVGMGYFAQINCQYDIKHQLYPYFLQAFKNALERDTYPHIACIEFPLFEELFNEFYQQFLPEPVYGGVTLRAGRRDLLNFTAEEREQYYVCVVNPSDANALPGNEWTDSSVESMLANNTSLRFDQVHLINPQVLDPSNWVRLRIQDHAPEEPPRPGI